MLRRALQGGATQLFVAGALLGSADPSNAEDPVAPGRGVPAWREISAGADATSNSWSAYSTSTFAPFGALDEDGLRLRTTSGYGRYHYSGTNSTEFRGINSFADLLLGYQAQLGTVTLKGFAGAAAIAHRLTPFDPDNAASGLDIGFKGAAEVWINLGESAWTSLDASWTAAHETYNTRLRAGWRFMPELSVGVEAGALGNASFDGARGGLFLRYAPDWGEISISGGGSGDIEKPDNPYATFNWLMRY